MSGRQHCFPAGQILICAESRITQTKVQERNGPELDGVFLDQLIKLVGDTFVELSVGESFSEAQGIFIFFEPGDEIHAAGPGSLFAQVEISVGVVVLGVAFPVGVRRMSCPILGHLFECLI